MHSLLIVGVTGLVGSSLIREAQRYHLPRPIKALSRSADPSLSRDGISYMKGDALKKDSLGTAFDDNPDVVSAVGILIDHSEDGKGYQRMNRDTAVNMADMMVSKYDGDRRCLVYFSIANTPPPMLISDQYLQSKREAENVLLSDKYKDKVRVVIMRPGIIYSYSRRMTVLPVALGLIVSHFLFNPIRAYLPSSTHFMIDRPLTDTDISHAVYKALEDEQVEGVCDVDRIRTLAREWADKHQ
ncbi:hypothetical protein BDB01DRAFT_774701 [Pilobolus umbonatus]|nr:hypothetical protein BDB01DRAFT_774701 [Pilobolus umbonatus]